MGGFHIRIRIIGGCGSGKSFIARELSERYGIPYFETDNFVWERGPEDSRRSPEARDARLLEAVASKEWIIEGVHYKWGIESFRAADLIFVITPNKYVRDLRVVQRFLKTNLGLEQRNYRQSLKNLYVMLFEWNRDFDREGLPKILELTEEFAVKRMVVKKNRDILKIVGQYANQGRG
ncbi:P-loop NTPase family protein [Paenibacillus tianjinensis]|uniref:DNA topology modulation protein FlaR n=1 Tax=Paenibacillus tianjinensis TaxID=2810347 RepID=A0ABX7LCS2_9BACL|nr:AAA family ATPase [Paenibacillus tianjinensis]QSF45939.1 hypothetical protein JRJ22_04715 [Paenibacillus tianjinensis]